MNTALRQDADTIIASSLKAVLPDAAVRRALESEAFCPQGGRILLVAVGKAAWQMAHTAVAALGRVDEGIVITKYGHVRGTISAPPASRRFVISCSSAPGISGFSNKALPPPERRNRTVSWSVRFCTIVSTFSVAAKLLSSGTG